MKERELLSLKTDNTGLCIVQDILFIGNPSEDSEEPDVAFDWKNGTLSVNDYELSPAQLLILKMYMNKEF